MKKLSAKNVINQYPDNNTTSFVGLIRLIKSDVRIYYPKGNWVKCFLIAYFQPKFKLMMYYRIGRYQYLKRKKLSLTHLYLNYKMYKLGGNEISFRAEIGTGCKLAHPTGVIVGETAIIGNNVTIFQQVTFGSHGRKGEKMCYPIVEDNVIIYAGAKLIGDITIGTGSVVGANSVVNIDVPKYSMAVGVPCKILNNKL